MRLLMMLGLAIGTLAPAAADDRWRDWERDFDRDFYRGGGLRSQDRLYDREWRQQQWREQRSWRQFNRPGNRLGWQKRGWGGFGGWGSGPGTRGRGIGPGWGSPRWDSRGFGGRGGWYSNPGYGRPGRITGRH